jgi:hypothetical protein
MKATRESVAVDWSPKVSSLKTIVCLANSRKPGGRCVAGLEVSVTSPLGTWIRPVGDRPSREVWLTEQRYSDGSGPQLLDRIQLGLQAQIPHEFQVENHLIDSKIQWVKAGSVKWHDLDGAVDSSKALLWIDGQSSYNGVNDRISHAEARPLTSSLRLIEIRDLIIDVSLEGKNPTLAARAHFSIGGTRYALKVTDPVVEATYLPKGEARHTIALARLCISLGEAFEGNCYKLVAGIITP